MTALCFHPTKDVAVTTSMDFTFKVWELNEVTGGRGFARKAKHKAWHCRSMSGYRVSTARLYPFVAPLPGIALLCGCKCNRFGCAITQECPARCAAFSHDGSLLAIGYQQVVTLWDPETCTIQETLTHPP